MVVVVAERAVAERAAETAVAVSAAGVEQVLVEQVLAMAATVADLAELVLTTTHLYSPLLTSPHRHSPLATRHSPLPPLTTTHHHYSLTTAHLAELVLDHGDLLAVVGAQDVVEQRRLAAAQEAGQHRHGHLGRGGSRELGRHRVGWAALRSASSLAGEQGPDSSAGSQTSRGKLGGACARR
eukprot:scaffold105787_cov66-Phaeocystis_antarctica.AAC.2